MASLAPSLPRTAQPWRRTVVSSLTTLLSRSGYLARRLRRYPGLRILTYHGVCADGLAGEAWLPRHFVTEGRFVRQMRILSDLGRIVHLPEVMTDLERGRPLRGPGFAITFDDGHASTLRHAVPIMRELGIRATFFVATGHVDHGEGFLSDRLGLLGGLPHRVRANMCPQLRFLVESPARSKRVPHDEVKGLLDEHWPAVAEFLDPRSVEALRPASWRELSGLHDSGHEIAAHTVFHVILGRETRQRRETEIVGSIRRVREHVSRCDGFAYPNGGAGDFDDHDVDILRREGVHYAVTTAPGRCVPPLDMYRLPRTSIGLGHDDHTFTLETSGWLDARRRRQHAGAWAALDAG